MWLLLAFGSCTNNTATLPNGILTKEKMVDIITDIQLLEAAQNEVSVGINVQKSMRDTNYIIVFNKYETDVVQFDSSMRVYTKYPKIMGDILDSVSTRISQEN